MKNLTALLATALGLLLLTAAPALAAAPETPVSGKVNPTSITATTATLEGGVLNPGASGPVDGGEYTFLYATPAGSGCEGQSEAPPLPGGIAAGLPQEPKSVMLTGLQPNATYEFCLYERNGEGEAVGPPVAFKTSVAPPTFGFYSPPSPSGAEVRLEAVVNPNNEETTCSFQYGVNSVIEHEVACEHEGENLKEGGEQGDAANVTGLTQRTTYKYRVVLKNAAGKTEGIPEEEFTTITPETPETLEASKIEATGTEATLNGVVNPKHEGEAGTYEFVYRQSATECEREGTAEKTIPSPAEASPATSPFPVSANLTKLLAGTTYTFCLLVHTSQGEALGAPRTFTTETLAPALTGEPLTNVGSSSATLHAQINPGGLPTTYFFEYGTNETYGSTTPSVSAGAGSEPVSVLANLGELQAETTYYYRLVASNAKVSSPVAGAAGSFSTFPVGVLGLPDGRGYELVSPLENGDATALGGHPVRAAADGSAVAYAGTSSPTAGNGEAVIVTSHGLLSGNNTYLATRQHTGGWKAADIQPAGLVETNYQAFTDDLSLGMLVSAKPVIPGTPEGQHLYTRDEETGSYQLLAANATYEGATPNGSHILIKDANGLYDSTGGQLESVNVLPEGGGIAPAAIFGSPAEPNVSSTGGLERVISDDGSRIFWSTLNGEQPEALYVRENDTSPDATTLQVDAAEPACLAENKCVSGGGLFWAASSDGSKVFFTDDHKLTRDSTAVAGKPDLYEYDLNSETGKPGILIDLTPDTGEPADVVGVLGASEDGSYVYFAAAGALPGSGAEHQECLPVVNSGEDITKCNIYVIHNEEGPKRVAVVAQVDGTGASHNAIVIPQGTSALFGDWERNVGFRSAHVTPDGRHLVFESFEDLTAFHSSKGRQIYVYDFGAGVSCLSCDPTGQSSTIGPPFQFAHSELPESDNSTFALRDLSDDGNRVFFVSNEQLVPQTTNGEVPLPDYNEVTGLSNVYEWEREGTDESCPEKTGGRTDGGCIFLLSTGTSTDLSYFVDASESGEDVFIESRANLTPRAQGETFKVYDVRVGATEPPAEPVCTGSGCQGVPAAPPIFATPSSVTFNGVGNFPAPVPTVVKKKVVKCAKGKKLSKGKCLKSKPRAKAKRKPKGRKSARR